MMGAVVFAFDFAQLEGVNGEAGVAVACEPKAMMMIGGLVAEADAILLHGAMSTEVENGGERFGGRGLGFIEVGGDVEAGARLEVEAFDKHVFGVDGAGNGGEERGAIRERIETQHVEELEASFGFLSGPLLGCREGS